MSDQSANKSNNPDKADYPREQRQTHNLKKTVCIMSIIRDYPSILVTFFGETEHFSGRIGALRWSILMRKQKHNVQKPSA